MKSLNFWFHVFGLRGKLNSPLKKNVFFSHRKIFLNRKKYVHHMACAFQSIANKIFSDSLQNQKFDTFPVDLLKVINKESNRTVFFPAEIHLGNLVTYRSTKYLLLVTLIKCIILRIFRNFNCIESYMFPPKNYNSYFWNA